MKWLQDNEGWMNNSKWDRNFKPCLLSQVSLLRCFLFILIEKNSLLTAFKQIRLFSSITPILRCYS